MTEDRAALLLPASPRQSPWRPGPFLSLALLVVVWWGCSAWNAVVSKRVLRRGTGSNGEALLRVAIVSAASNVLGVLGMVAMRFVPRLSVIRPVVGREIAAAHAIGLYAAYRGLVGAKVSSCQAVKALEPLIAMAMSATPFFAGGREYVQRPAAQAVVAAIIAVTGVIVVCVEDASYEVEALFWVLCSSLLTQGRNQFMKVRQRQSHSRGVQDHEDASKTASKSSSAAAATSTPSPAIQGLLIFVATSAGAFYVNLVMVIAELVLRPGVSIHSAFEGDKTGAVFMAGLSHFLYNLASFGVLSFVVPATHSLANTAKRAIIVCASAFFLHDKLTSKGWAGLALVIVGSGYYSYFAKSRGKKQIAANTNDSAQHTSTATKQSNRACRGQNAIVLATICVFSALGLQRRPSSCLYPNVEERTSGVVPLYQERITLSSATAGKCNYSGKRVTFFTAAGNGNWGDNMQPWTWANLFQAWGIPLSALSSASCDTCVHAYPWLNETSKLRISQTTREREANADDSLVAAFEDADVLWFGGGGLFGYPHRPLAHNAGNWQQWAVDTKGIVPVFAAVGSTANANGANLIKTASKLVESAAFVSGRGSIEVTAFDLALGESSSAKNFSNVPVMPDPILSDYVTYPMQSRSRTDTHKDRPICWIFRSEDKEFLKGVSSIVNKNDIVYAMEGKDGNYHGLLPHATLRVFNRGTDFYGDISSSCKMMVSQRYHGVIMGLRAGIPVVGLYEYFPHKVSDVMELIGESNCMSPVSDLLKSSRMIHDCYINFDVEQRYKRLGEIQNHFQQMFQQALFASGICS